MASRQYLSFLLRFWLVDSPNDGPESMVLQVQHLQTGATWRVRSLHELNDLLALALEDAPASTLLPNPANTDQRLPAPNHTDIN